jgi:hypothetical protein
VAPLTLGTIYLRKCETLKSKRKYHKMVNYSLKIVDGHTNELVVCPSCYSRFMDKKAPETALVPTQTDLQVALRGAVSLWASATTSESERRADLLRDKQRIVLSFFLHTEKLPSSIGGAEKLNSFNPGSHRRGSHSLSARINFNVSCQRRAPPGRSHCAIRLWHSFSL